MDSGQKYKGGPAMRQTNNGAKSEYVGTEMDARNNKLRDDPVTAARPALPDVGTAPRLLTRKQAAAYCGVSLRTFIGLCPVRPIALGQSKRMQRYDLRALDQWIDTLPSDKASFGKDWLATLGTDHDDHARKRT